jgi:hypothetical protein
MRLQLLVGPRCQSHQSYSVDIHTERYRHLDWVAFQIYKGLKIDTHFSATPSYHSNQLLPAPHILLSSSHMDSITQAELIDIIDSIPTDKDGGGSSGGQCVIA